MTGPNPPGPGAGGADDGGSHRAGPGGGMRFQDPNSTTPREPTLAEQRERERVRREAEAEAARQAEEQAKDAARRSRRKKQLIGGGVAVGLVGVVAAWYLAAPGQSHENAHCVDENQQVVDDSYCGDNSRGHSSGGMFFFYGGGGHRYQYYYGGNNTVGQRATGGSLTPGSGKSYANSSGKSVGSDGKTGGAVSRGGFGSKSSGSKSGSSGSKSGSSGSSGKSSGS